MNHHHQKGAQAVEFALVLPFMILIIFAVLDFGILVYDKAIITNAGREAARRGVILSGAAWNPALIKQVACNYAKDSLITVSSATRTDTCTGIADPDIKIYTGATANCPNPTGASPPSTPVFQTPVAVTISYAVKGFSLGSWWSLGIGDSAIGSAITLTSCTQMNHE